MKEIDELKLKEKRRQEAEANPFRFAPYEKKAIPPELSADEVRKLRLYREHEQGDEDERINQGLEPQPTGHEGYKISGAGYLRYRKIYMGDDGYKPEGASYAINKPDDKMQPQMANA